MSGSTLLDALTNPGVDALLGAAQGFAQAAMPTRMPVPWGAALGMGGAGALQGLRSGQQLQLAQQQIRQAQLGNERSQIGLDWYKGLTGAMQGVPGAQGSTGAAAASPAGGASPAAVGPSVSPGTGAPVAAPNTVVAGQQITDANGRYLVPPRQLVQLGAISLAMGDPRAAAQFYGHAQTAAGGAGYSFSADGTSFAVPGGPKDPATIARNTGAEAWAKVPAAIAQAGGVKNAELPAVLAAAGFRMNQDGTFAPIPGGKADPAYVGQTAAAKAWAGVAPAVAQAGGEAAARAPYQPPVTYTALGPDGAYHDYSVPVPAWAAQNGAGGAAGATSGYLPAATYVQRITAAENPGGNPAAPNASGPGGAATSSAMGNGQFLNNTWLPLFKQSFPQQAAGLSDQQILALRSDPKVSGAMTLAYARQNAPALEQAGIAPTGAALGLAHRFGAQGAISLLHAPAGSMAAAVLPPDVIQANPTLANQPVSTIVGNAAMRFGMAPVNLGGTIGGGAPAGAIMGKPQYTPEQAAVSGGYGDVAKQIIAAGNKAPVNMERLQVLENAARYFRPGATGEMRMEGAKLAVDGLQAIGLTPPAWLANGAAGAETIGKEGGFLAAEMTRQMGSREAASVFNMIRGIQPNIEMSQGGFGIIVNSLREGILRDQDMLNFQTRWLADPSHGGSIAGMIQAFNDKYPVQAYASRVIPFPVPAKPSALIPNTIYRNKAGQSALWTGTGFQPIGGGGG